MLQYKGTMGKQKVFVGISGGVDSSVVLALLKQWSYDVTGVFLKVWSPDFLPCAWRDERRSAMRVCTTLGVPFMTLDCEKEYKELVVDYMLSEYKAGRTPNPDVFCNKYVKFGVFLRKAIEMGADFVATGHYARVARIVDERGLGADLRGRETNYRLLESADKKKDQSYFLHQLNQEQLAHILFPVGHLQKSEVRKLAQKFGLPTAEKKDSQGLCFIGKVDMKEFLAHYIKSEPGDVLNEVGEIIGQHNGAIFYTIGERHGFMITSQTIADSMQTNAEREGQRPRLFVVAKDIEKNTITVGTKVNQTSDVGQIKVSEMHWISEKAPDLKIKYNVRFRYGQERQECKIVKTESGFEIIPDDPQFGIAPGQSAVIYSGEVCLGGGVIE